MSVAPLQQLDARLGELRRAVHHNTSRPAQGRVVRAVGPLLRALMPGVFLGELCTLPRNGKTALLAEVVGFEGDEVILAPIGDVRGLSLDCPVERTGDALRVPVGDALLGRVLDGLGQPLDEETMGRLPSGLATRPCHAEPPPALARARVSRPMAVGVRAIDGLLTCGEGQRIGIYGEPGAGKSTLLAQLVRGADVDVAVIGLIGERGREVREFIEHHLDAAGRARSVLVVATSDRPAAERLKAAYAATTIAEAFRDEGRRVLLVMDSITRFARAAREIGLAAGEPPTRRGFPPSVLTELPRLMERSGPGRTGSITAFYTVLIEGDGTADPIAEETRSILDGHVALSSRLAQAGQFPPIDVLASRSRVMDLLTSATHQADAANLRDLLHRHGEVEFLAQVGEYKRGVDPRNDEALDRIDAIRAFLRQGADQQVPFQDTVAWLTRLNS